MKKFTKLALVASVAISANAMAMQAMDDATLGVTTGQDGINIGIGLSKIEIEKLYIHDNDGLTAAGTAGTAGFGGTSTAGAISIKANGTGATATNGIVISTNTDSLLTSRNLADLTIDSDAGVGGDDSAFINIGAKVSGLNIAIGEIGVTASNAVPGVGATSIRRGGNDANYNAVLSGLTLKTGKMDANIQVGASPQGAMIILDTTMIGGLEITNLGILDNSTKLGDGTGNSAANRAAGEIYIDSIKVATANSTDLAVDAKVSVYGKTDTSNGYLQILAGTKNTTGTDIYVSGVKLGSSAAASIGDIEVQGLQTYYMNSPTTMAKGSVITVSGH
ncbi:pilus assembly protein FilA [Acinetobacter albensis]|uniref:putative pilus system protein FilA n=1 Tax=Acinetobacter albensis TaxID=1673609 RepID=UPI0018823412|nr:DUF6160 family protein [Acinetobacter albensis]MBE9401581.1 pilus assembly protein FilA [Acinetobacter albensis]